MKVYPKADKRSFKIDPRINRIPTSVIFLLLHTISHQMLFQAPYDKIQNPPAPLVGATRLRSILV